LRNTSLLSCWSNQPLAANCEVPITTIRDNFSESEDAGGVGFGLGDAVGDAVGDAGGVASCETITE
jgi:hypothetical protein